MLIYATPSALHFFDLIHHPFSNVHWASKSVFSIILQQVTTNSDLKQYPLGELNRGIICMVL